MMFARQKKTQLNYHLGNSLARRFDYLNREKIVTNVFQEIQENIVLDVGCATLEF